jgi:polar amino acid transport system substrate-binding protein
VGLLVNNALFVNPGTTLGGVAVDLGRELAARIGVSMEPVRYANVAAMVEAADRDEWDIAFLGIDPERAAHMNFTSAYVYGENTFLLAPGSTAKTLADLDRPGRTVATLARSVQETWARQNMKGATLISVSGPPSAFQLLKDGKVDAVASATQVLSEGAKGIPGTRLMDGSYLDTPVGLAVAKGRPAAHAYAYAYIEEMKASGAVRESLARTSVSGARVAPAGAK